MVGAPLGIPGSMIGAAPGLAQVNALTSDEAHSISIHMVLTIPQIRNTKGMDAFVRKFLRHVNKKLTSTLAPQQSGVSSALPLQQLPQ